MKLLAVFLLTSSVLGCAFAQINPWFLCPEPETITPCECIKACENDCNAIFHCSNLTRQSQIDEVIEKSDFPFRTVHIENSALQYIPHKVFEEKKFHYVTIKQCTFLSLIDGPLHMDTPLHFLRLESLVFRRGFQFDAFSSMKLEDLIIKKIDVRKIPNDVCHYLPSELERLDLYHTNTAKIGDTAFYSCRSLVHLSITRGNIETIKSSMFPRNLMELVLTNNKIKNLPNDFASYFPKLAALYLNENQLTYIEENIYGKLPELKYLSVRDNPLVCNCKLRWKVGRQSPYIDGTCSNPNMHGKKIMDLTDDDFAYCV